MPNDDPDWASPVNQPIRLLGTVTAAAGGSQTDSFALADGVVGVGYIADATNSHSNPVQVQVTGDVTQQPYILDNSPAAGLHGDYIAQGVDTSVSVKVSGGVGLSSLVNVLSLSGPVVALLSRVAQLSPQPWQAPVSTVLIDNALNNSNAVLVAGVSGQTVYLHGWTATFSAVAAADVILESVTTAQTYDIWNAVGSVGPYRGDGKGIAVALGDGVRIRNPFAVAVTVRGALQFTQK